MSEALPNITANNPLAIRRYKERATIKSVSILDRLFSPTYVETILQRQRTFSQIIGTFSHPETLYQLVKSYTNWVPERSFGLGESPPLKDLLDWIELYNYRALIDAIFEQIPTSNALIESLENNRFSNALKIKKIRAWLRENRETLKTIQTLDLSNRRISTLVPEMYLFVNLKKLELQGNQLLVISKVLLQLSNLKTIDVQDNPDLTFVPAGLRDRCVIFYD